ncbi:MAG: hypothetical protein PUB96_07890 [Helicobacteraceae bacterium]|nr:hypothetical protein [Helicobacteraceae bacterium]
MQVWIASSVALPLPRNDEVDRLLCSLVCGFASVGELLSQRALRALP